MPRAGARPSFTVSPKADFEQYRKQAQELVAQDCDLLLALRSEPTARALQFLRPAAPILFLAVDYHPLASGMVTNLRSPDRNTTGVYVPQNALVARRVETLREVLPQAKRLMVFADAYSADQVDAARKAAAAANLQLLLVQFVTEPYDYNTFLREKGAIDADAFMNLASPIFTRDRRQIHEAVLRLRMPSIGYQRVTSGGRAICCASAATSRRSPSESPKSVYACWPARELARYRSSRPTISSS